MKYTITGKPLDFRVWPAEEPQVLEVKIENGAVTKTTRPISKIFQGYHPSVFDAYYRPQYKDWMCDIDCGMQRWCGSKTTREVRAAMRKCGFDEITIKKYTNTSTKGDGI